MARKKRKVEVISTKLTFVRDDVNNPSFSNLLDYINGKEVVYNEKEFEFKLMDTTLANCKVGLIETMQSKDLPPKKNRRTKIFTKLPINPDVERLAFANVFLYDIDRNILIYEVNRNGCFPDKLKEAIYYLWNSNAENEDVRFELNFPTILRQNAYNKALNMGYYKRVRAQILSPTELLRTYDEKTDSTENNIIKHTLEAGAQSNADTVILEQLAITKKMNPMGLSHSKIKNILDSVRAISNESIAELSVQGYFTDPEESKGLRKINLLADTFDACFHLDEVQIQSDVQPLQRKGEIEALYLKLLPEFQAIIGR